MAPPRGGPPPATSKPTAQGDAHLFIVVGLDGAEDRVVLAHRSLGKNRAVEVGDLKAAELNLKAAQDLDQMAFSDLVMKTLWNCVSSTGWSFCAA